MINLSELGLVWTAPAPDLANLARPWLNVSTILCHDTHIQQLKWPGEIRN